MYQPTWRTDQGILGVYFSLSPLNIQLKATPVRPSTEIFYELLSGNLPEGLETDPVYLDISGKIAGTPKNIISQQKFIFTVRAIDEFKNVSDRTFEMLLIGFDKPKIKTPPGQILTVLDSEFVNYKILYDNPITTNKVSFNISAGSLPPGLYLTSNGNIKGYPAMPKLPDNSPTKKTYTFSVQLSSPLGKDLQTYSITIKNQELSQPKNIRRPVILNSNPLKEPISNNDPYYDYYILEDRTLPTIKANQYFSFKIIGYDFEQSDIVYQYNGLPPGLVGNNTTGWITGVPIMQGRGISKYKIEVSVAKKNITSIVSDNQIIYLVVKNDLEEDIKFVTEKDLGIVYNGRISSLSISASSSLSLNYRIIAGNLPKNLYMNELGEIIGKVAEQTETTLTLEGKNNIYKFTVEAFSADYPIVKKSQEFTLTINQYYPDPLENIYFKALPNMEGKKLIKNLLTNDDIIPEAYLYRPADPYYGKAKDVSFVHVYGMKSSNINEYINATQKNHYLRKIILGELGTAIATDSVGNTIYEVVYSKIVDNLNNEDDTSVSKTLTWNKNINLRIGPWNINNTDLRINDSTIKTNLSPGEARILNPASLTNMKNELIANIDQNTDDKLLPEWMTTQQANGNTLGYIRAWVICYAKPGYANTIKNLIENNWGHKLNEIEFLIDRFFVDKSSNYNYNTNFSTPTWIDLPSATPVPNPINSYDLGVIFPRKTILPRDYE